MNNLRIIYSGPTGRVMAITPNPDCGLTIEQVAAKDVPVGVAYQIIDAADLPSREHRNLWVTEITSPDGVGANYGIGTDWSVIEYLNGEAYRVLNQVTGEIKLVGDLT